VAEEIDPEKKKIRFDRTENENCHLQFGRKFLTFFSFFWPGFADSSPSSVFQ
jgi:hypothetical protein